MCGILGKRQLSGPMALCQTRFQDALDLQQHRGPDNAGTFFQGDIALGHRRLSIIDLSDHANQPMLSADGQVALVFNGEIYNYVELRERLSRLGHQFASSGDTEVLLAAYCEYGADCVQHLRGMFAFAVHDMRRAETLLVRDRVGIKPLYYRHDGNALTFASEIKSILHLDRVRPEINTTAVVSYLSYRYPILNDTFFDGIESLEPGCLMRIRDGAVSIERYWNPCQEFEKQNEDRGEAFYTEQLRELLADSVRYRMIADVPSGAFLSGGVDSSVLTALMAGASDDPIKTFTIGFQEQGYNEFDFARMLADRYETEHRQIALSGEHFLDTMQTVIGFKDAPLSVPNEVPLFLMSKILREDITVVLSGEGADEIFGGYGRIFRSSDDYLKSQPQALAEMDTAQRAAFESRFLARYGVTGFDSELDHFLASYRYTSLQDKRQLLSPEVNLRASEQRLAGRFQRVFDELPRGTSYFNKMLWAFLRVHVPGLLHRVDTTTMAASVEARVPFLDHHLIEFMCGVPESYKLRWNSAADRSHAQSEIGDVISERFDTPKYLLKKSYEDMVPHEILYRRKMGFPVPLNQWFGGRFNQYARDILMSRSSIERGIINPSGVDAWLSDDNLAVDHGHAMKIWMLVNLELFFHRYMDGPATP